MPGSAASGAGRAVVWPARRRNGAALAEATEKHRSFVTPGSETFSGDRRGGGEVCRRGLGRERAHARGATAECAVPWKQGWARD